MNNLIENLEYSLKISKDAQRKINFMVSSIEHELKEEREKLENTGRKDLRQTQ